MMKYRLRFLPFWTRQTWQEILSGISTITQDVEDSKLTLRQADYHQLIATTTLETYRQS